MADFMDFLEPRDGVKHNNAPEEFPMKRSKWIRILGVFFLAVLLGGIIISLLIPRTRASIPPENNVTTTEEFIRTGDPEPFPPPTRRPLPPHPETFPPVSLLYEMEKDPPTFVPVPCLPAQPPVFRFNVIVANHTFTSQGGNSKREAKSTSAMVANEALFGFKYPAIPTPHSVCHEADSEDKEE